LSGDLQLLPINGELLYTFDFTADVPEDVTVDAIDYVVPAQLTQYVDVDDLANFKGTAGFKCSVSGKHGMIVQVECKATLSNSEKVPKYLTIRLSGS